MPSLASAQSPLPPTATRLPETPLLYRVLEGDTLIDVARKYLRDPLDYRHLQRDNGIANPRRIPIGRTISINPALLRTRNDPAQLATYRGSVRVIRSGQPTSLSSGMALIEGDIVATEANSFARIAFSDGSHTVVPSNSRLRLERLRRFVINDQPDHHLVVDQGRTENRVSARQSPGGFRVSTPTAIAAVRGTEFRVAYDEQLGISATAVLEGAVTTAAEAGTDDEAVLVREGQGVSTRQGLDTLSEAQLLSAPSLDPDSSLQTQDTLSFITNAPQGSAMVRGWIGQDASVLEPLAELEARTGSGPLTLDDLPEGQWFLRLTAVSPDLIEGHSRTFNFIRARNGIEGLEQEQRLEDSARVYRFAWQSRGEGAVTFRFQLSQTDTEGRPIGAPLVDTPAISEPAFILTDLPKGDYSWRVESSRYRFGQRLAAWSKPERLTISH